MKSKLFKLITGLGLFAFVTTVSAYEISNLDSVIEGNNSANAEVTVGEVATPVYSMHMVWDDLTFDWVYDGDSNSYGWAPAPRCTQVTTLKEEVDALLQDGKEVYSNDTCSERVYSYIEGGDNTGTNVRWYYVLEEREYVSMHFEDNSQNGQLVPSIRWQSEDKYSDVSANFKYLGETCVAINTEEVFNIAKDRGIYFDSSCTRKTDTAPTYVKGEFYTLAYKYLDLKTEEIPDLARGSFGMGTVTQDGLVFPTPPEHAGKPFMYDINFNLEGGEEFPISGDTIGTVTVSIRAK